MSDNIQRMAENKLILLFLLYQMDIPLSSAQIVDFAVEKEYIDYFDCMRYIKELLDSNMTEASTAENNVTVYGITSEGIEILRLFAKQIPHHKRSAICNYVSANKKRIKREFEVVANYFYNDENDYTIKCGIYEDDKTIIEINTAVFTKEQAKAIKHNWQQNVTDLYGKIISLLLDENNASSMEEKLQSDFDNSHVNKHTQANNEEE